jgi:hypothetical protein
MIPDGSDFRFAASAGAGGACRRFGDAVLGIGTT